VEEFCKSTDGSTLLRAEWTHKKSVSSAYWDPRGRSIVSTSYDDTIRRGSSPCALRAIVLIRMAVWDINSSALDGDDKFASSRPFKQISHDCQTVRALESTPSATILTCRQQGKWLTILKAQWAQNPDVYPHFTIGNMNHSLNIFSAKGDLLAKLSDGSK